MARKKQQSPQVAPASSVRAKARQRLAGATPRPASLPAAALVHELQVHQIELEMQNDELKRTHHALEESRDEFVDLYDFAPIGYLTITRTGLVAAANLTVAGLLGVPRSQLLTGRFRQFVAPADLVQWDRHLLAAFQHPEKQMCELALRRKDGTEFPVRLDSFRKGDGGEQSVLRVAVSDITARKRAERLESEGRFHIMADAAPVLIWTSGLDKLCTYFNKPWLEFTGRTMKQELGNGWAEGVHPDDLPRCLKTYTSAFDARREFRMEYRLRRHDGQYRWILDHGVPRFDGANEFVGYIGSCVDITDRRQAEELLRDAHAQLEQRVLRRTAELRESEQTLERLFQFAPDAMVVADADGRIVRVNQREEALFGYTAKELIGKRVEVLLPKRLRRQHVPQRRGYGTHPRVRQMGGGADLLGRRKDGSEFPVDIMLAPLPARDGTLTMAVIRDITEPKRAEAELRLSEERYRAVVEAAQDAFIAFNSAGEITEWNRQAEAIFGWSRREAVGRLLAETIIPPPYRQAHRHSLQQFLATGVSRVVSKHIEMPALHRAGHEFPVELNISPIRLGKEYTFAAFLHDITARRRLERELVEISEREQQRFGQELHDTVAQTLAGVAMMSEGLQHELEARALSVASLATRIAQCANLAAGQAHDLARSLFPLELHRAGLLPALRELANTVTKLYGIRCRLTNNGPVTDLDVAVARQLFRIAQEAATNAGKHSRGTRIEIGLASQPESVTLTVGDNGVGLKRATAKSKRMGLHILQHRANLIGATLEIRPAARGGTVVACTVEKGKAKLIR